MSVALTNRTRRLVAYTLGHDVYCERLGHCACTDVGGTLAATSLTLRAGETRAGLHPAVLFVPAIMRAARRGVLSSAVRRDTPPADTRAVLNKRRRARKEGGKR